eukprot:3288203-Amphidinium_carterae.1
MNGNVLGIRGKSGQQWYTTHQTSFEGDPDKFGGDDIRCVHLASPLNKRCEPLAYGILVQGIPDNISSESNIR